MDRDIMHYENYLLSVKTWQIRWNACSAIIISKQRRQSTDDEIRRFLGGLVLWQWTYSYFSICPSDPKLWKHWAASGIIIYHGCESTTIIYHGCESTTIIYHECESTTIINHGCESPTIIHHECESTTIIYHRSENKQTYAQLPWKWNH